MTGFDGNTFTYDARGRRIRKNNIYFTYDSNGKLIKQSNGLEFIYDHTGLLAVEYNGSRYFYRKNVQNDIIALLDNDGNIVVKYMYDACSICLIQKCPKYTMIYHGSELPISLAVFLMWKDSIKKFT